jgi:small-conductance mechanosensitive channel
MRKETLGKIVAILLIFIGVVMVGITYKLKILPPGLTGLGFFLIAIYMLKKG